ncbi:uncharacterized protein LOC129945840 [Eupeodes corollae]|uniref:uncharacterized protein LOC129945840 n=1 Tax=Eupeodes corollae TaxID=290404 RepID=UPI00248FB195|nr:uncharacterized protein LOC129945840 [Eupeodes corollae]
MKRTLWGSIKEKQEETLFNKLVSQTVKQQKLNEAGKNKPKPKDLKVFVKVKNPLVTQTIEVMKQTEMLQSLIDTYSNKSGSNNYLLNPCQMIPQVDFPPENATDFVNDDKFAKPLWFIPPNQTDFTRGEPKEYPQINKPVCKESLRKAICGQLCIAGFTDTAESALVLFTDALEEFIRNFILQIKDIQCNEHADRQSSIDILTLERAYYALTSTSLTAIHNYFKNNLIARNRSEIREFRGVLQEYDKLMKESQSMQKGPFQENDFMNFLDFTATAGPTTQDNSTASTSGHVVGYIEGQNHITVQNSR